MRHPPPPLPQSTSGTNTRIHLLLLQRAPISPRIFTSTTTSILEGRSNRRQGLVPTASQAGPSSANDSPSSAITTPPRSNAPAQPANPRIPSPSFQPTYPSPSIPARSTPEPQVRVTSPTRWSLRNALIGGGNETPFRNRANTGASTGATRARRPSAGRLWNPTNSTPRSLTQASQRRSETRRRNRSPDDDRAVVAVPLSHPALGQSREEGGVGGAYPLLTLPEQRRSRHSGSTRDSLQVERSGSSNDTNRISLPRSVSIDIQRRRSGESSPAKQKLNKGKGRATDDKEIRIDLPGAPRSRLQKKPTGLRKRGQSVSNLPTQAVGISPADKGKGKAIMSTDLERGPVTQNPYQASGTSNVPHARPASRTSIQSGIGPAISSSNTSIIGDDGPPNPAEEWGPQHPCFPHMNSHVPLSSPLYQTTRIIRIRRDWMVEGDLAPTFSNLYPEILDPAGVSEQDFRLLVEKINSELVPAFNPWGFRNIFDGILGVLTGWIWVDFGFTGVKSRLKNVEKFLEDWNREMETKSKQGDGSAPKIVSLRRTGYLNLDIQVPDPEIVFPGPGDERTETGLSRATQ